MRLELTDVSKRFGGITAVDGVSLEVREGEVVGLIGPNGAGKTTLFDLISGFLSPDTGHIDFAGQDVTSWAANRRAMAGLGRSFQDARIFPSMTVAENIAMGLERHLEVRDPFAAALGLPAVTDAEEDVAWSVHDLIELMSLGAFRDKFVGELSTGSRRIVDLAMAIAHEPSVLLLDEPSSGIAQRETEALGPLLMRIKNEVGCSLLVIEHDMPLITSISDTMLALELGRVIASGTPTEVVNHPHVVASYLGTDADVVNRSGPPAGRRRGRAGENNNRGGQEENPPKGGPAPAPARGNGKGKGQEWGGRGGGGGAPGGSGGERGRARGDRRSASSSLPSPRGSGSMLSGRGRERGRGSRSMTRRRTTLQRREESARRRRCERESPSPAMTASAPFGRALTATPAEVRPKASSVSQVGLRAAVVDRGWIRRVGGLLLARRGRLVTALLAAVLSMAVTAAIPLVLRAVMDGVIVARRGPALPWMLLLLGMGVVRLGAAFLRRNTAGLLGLGVEYQLRTLIYDHLQRLDFARHDELQTGQLVSRAHNDVGLVQNMLFALPVQTSNILQFVISIGVMAVLSPTLTAVAILVLPAVALVAFRMRRLVYVSSWDSQQRAAEVAGVVEEAVTGVRVVKGFGQEDRELGHLVSAAETLFGTRMRNIRITNRYLPLLDLIPTLGQVAILAVGGWMTIRHRISLGTFLAFNTYLVQLVSPVRGFAGFMTQTQNARAGAERIFELLDSTPVVLEEPDAGSLDAVKGEITFDAVTFGYLRSEPVLRGFSLVIAPGETVALVGASGSGKSTVALLLPRFYDVQEGVVRVESTDVRDVTLHSLRAQVGVVFEDTFLFSESVRANIAYGRPESTDAEVLAAARAAGANTFITALPDGFDTVVGERGYTLSGGSGSGSPSPAPC